jgi:hypothetical protein
MRESTIILHGEVDRSGWESFGSYPVPIRRGKPQKFRNHRWNWFWF